MAPVSKTSGPTIVMPKQPPLRYRRPLLSIVPVFLIFALFTYYCAFGVVDPNDSTKLLAPAEVLEVLAARQKAPIGDPVHKVHLGLLLHRITDKFYGFGCKLLGGLKVQQGVCAFGWFLHAAEAVYAYTICRKRRASASVTWAYVVGVLIGGVTQFLPLKKEASRI